MSELKPCPMPKCGGEAELKDHRLRWSVSCCKCDLTVIGEKAPEPETEEECDSIDWNYYEQSAIKKWNKVANAGMIDVKAMLKAAGDQDEN